LANGVAIEVHASNYQGVRGHTVICAIADEIAFWPTDEFSRNPDTEIINALRPAMAMVPGSLLVAISSPYARVGELWNAYKRSYGKDLDLHTLVWRAPTIVMNPAFPQGILEREYEKDPAVAAAEYGAEFRSDLEAFVPQETVDAAVTPGISVRAPLSSVSYVAFCDPAGGSGSDSFTLGIAHVENGTAILDCCLERKPRFSPEAVVTEFAATLKQYRVTRVIGDRYAGEWPREQFRNHGISYEPSERTRSEIYVDLLPLLNSGKVQLLDNPRLVSQLVGLERRTSRAGKDSIDHPPGNHDDVANACAGAIVNLKSVSKPKGATWPSSITERVVHYV
jgi:hypothetical protein